AGVHFPLDTPPYDIGYKAVAVNLSDMAAMGAQPRWMTLALTLPQADTDWVQAFADGLFAAAQAFDVALIGGDTTRGPLTISIQIAGTLPPDRALRRTGAQVGDAVYVSGTLGDAGLGLAFAQGKCILSTADGEYCLQRLRRPTPRVALGLALRGIATSAIDVSDGLSADLAHILTASRVGASLNLDALPLSPALRRLSAADATQYALHSGDDYELCFTAPQIHAATLTRIAQALDVPLTQIGHIEPASGLRGYSANGSVTDLRPQGYEHFP
ncbi:MAG: thiamine-phosphate kinase, partial [Gammaproteobacteria bacterium]|nr:thiamine-phosphate kinase [Gammaproteobacteria bacterium]